MSFHLFHVRELYSSADGRVQFIEFVGEADGEQFWAGHPLISTSGAATREFVFPTNLPSASTAGRSVLVAAQSFAALGLVTPDYIVPDGFLFTAGGTVGVPGQPQATYAALPTTGTQSVDQGGSIGTGSPTNFAGAGATIPGNPVVGTAGANHLVGTGGNDFIVGLAGNDTLHGGTGNDAFRFDAALSSATVPNVDRITDFDPAADTIQPENSIFTRFGTSTTGPIASASFRANSTGRAQDANDTIVYETDTGRLFYDADGSGSGAAVQFAVLGVSLSLTSADFVLV